MVTPSDCRPYVSVTLFQTAATGKRVCAAVRNEIADLILELSDRDVSSGRIVDRTVRSKPNVQTGADGERFGILQYTEDLIPVWYTGTGVTNRLHQLTVVGVKLPYVALVFTDAAMRNRVVNAMSRSRTSQLKRLSLLSRSEMERAFVGKQVKTVWLSGTHRRSAVKADSKVLSGMELEAAFDPLDDQTYAFSSVRTPFVPTTPLQRDRVAGVSPARGRAWLGSSTDWVEFRLLINALLDRIAEVRANPNGVAEALPVLAQPIDSLSGIDEPYGMAVIIPEANFSDFDSAGDAAWITEFQDGATFTVSPHGTAPGFRADVFWGDQRFGAIAYTFQSVRGGGFSLQAETIEWDDTLYKAKAVFAICRNADFLTIHYDTGHTFSRGGFFRTQFRDMEFNDWVWSPLLGGFNLKAEKPNVLGGRALDIAGIGEAADTSLFGFVAKNWPNCTTPGAPTGWLACDDGSMESADFIHFDEQGRVLSLIHVKGSKSDKVNRRVSVTDYEVVVGQAIKNLRYLDRNNIADKLEETAGNQIGSAVWFNGQRQADRVGMIAALRAAGSNLTTRVFVFQPRTRMQEVERLRDEIANEKANSDVLRLRQLDTLLLAARADCFKLGAEFHVLAHDDR